MLTRFPAPSARVIAGRHTLVVYAILSAFLGSSAFVNAEPFRTKLWESGAPDAVGNAEQDAPSISVYLPENHEPAAGIVICPGGGYSKLETGHEGKQVACWLNERGIAGFVLRYRLPKRYRHPVPLDDARRAIRLVRSNSEKWKVDPDKIGIWGFSAGGHLASQAGTHFDNGDQSADDLVNRFSCRPDYMILSYPFISLSDPQVRRISGAYIGARLLGEKLSQKGLESLSSERQVTRETPPTFLIHAEDDPVVRLEHSLLFHRSLRRHGVSTELHTFENGGHGFGLATDHPTLCVWPSALEKWLSRRYSSKDE